MVVPLSELSSTQTEPPWRSAISHTRESPNPAPPYSRLRDLSTRKETGILEYLMVHQGRPVSQEELMDHVWDNSVDGFSNSIRVHISALRKKLRAVLGYDPIRNRIGEGYLMGGEES